MYAKRLVIGSLIGLVSLYIVGYIIWDVVLAGFFDANRGTATGVEREAQVIWAMALGTLFYGVLLTLALESRGGSTSLVDALKVGAVVGFLLWGTADFILFSYTNLNNLTAAIADTVLEGIRGGICGATIAVVLNIGQEKVSDRAQHLAKAITDDLDRRVLEKEGSKPAGDDSKEETG